MRVLSRVYIMLPPYRHVERYDGNYRLGQSLFGGCGRGEKCPVLFTRNFNEKKELAILDQVK